MTKVLDRFTLLQKLLLLLVTFVLSVSVIAFICITTIQSLRSGGEMQSGITTSNELLADTLPPPLFIIEARNAVALLRIDKSEANITRMAEQLRLLQQSFQQRYDYTLTTPLNSQERELIADGISLYAKSFFNRALGTYLTALRSGDESAIDREFRALQEDGRLQEEAVHRLVIAVTAAAEAYKAQVNAQVESSLSQAYWVIGLGVLAFVVIFSLSLQSIRAQLGADPATVRDAMRRLLAGDSKLDLKVTSSDKDSLLAGMSEVARRFTDNSRVRSALDNVSSNVMIADNDRNIIYMNKTVFAMLQNAESDLRKVLPSFDTNKLQGGSIDQFHKNPEHQKRLLATFTSTFRTQIVVGPRTFALVANPVLNESGERLGSVVEWADRTVEVAVEREVASLVTAAGAGDFSQRIEVSDKEGFFLNLATGLNQLMATSDKGLKDVVRVLGALAEGNLTQRIDAEYQGTFGQLKDYSNETAQSLSSMLGQIRESADTIYTAASEIATGNADLSARTEQQASSLEETASSMEELTSTVKLNADNARQANSLAANASEVAITGGAVVQQVVHTMSSINDSARKISDIIGVIDGIAFQTNILALNAAVEAARAGDQGRGFAVVAAEVRTLAQRSAAAAKEIKTLISDSVDKVDTGNALVAKAGVTMGEIVVAIKRVTDIMSEIAAASAEQSTGIEEVNGAVSQMDEMTQQNAALVEQAAAAAESMQEQASVLSQAVAVFKFDEAGSAHMSAPRLSPQRAAPSISRTAGHSVSRAKAPVKVLPRSSKPKDDEWEEF
ncbi:MAG: methyl-accepting chemotaxis protein [Pseudomonas sp.]|nr:methyl-accepting chemotaxis protein [Pseudomonas sp.]MDP3845336.1 methyl-accepting chemotaxis protein [Pseudomonas sp.]